MLEIVPDVLNEGGPDVPVDDAVVEGAGEVHHVPDHNLVVPDHGPLLDLVDPEDCDLGPVDDRRRQDAALLAEGRDRERGALDLCEGEFLVARRIREPLDFLREIPKVLPVRLVDYRHREALVRGGCDANVVVSLNDDLLALVVDGGVEGGEVLEVHVDRVDAKTRGG